jgi:hypothetical protein
MVEMEPLGMDGGQAVFITGIGRPLGWKATLAQLEADIARARALGAPDDAIVSRAIPGSIYAAEIVWVGETEEASEG